MKEMSERLLRHPSEVPSSEAAHVALFFANAAWNESSTPSPREPVQAATTIELENRALLEAISWRAILRLSLALKKYTVFLTTSGAGLAYGVLSLMDSFEDLLRPPLLGSVQDGPPAVQGTDRLRRAACGLQHHASGAGFGGGSRSRLRRVPRSGWGSSRPLPPPAGSAAPHQEETDHQQDTGEDGPGRHGSASPRPRRRYARRMSRSST